jgi:hypothetical protein
MQAVSLRPAADHAFALNVRAALDAHFDAFTRRDPEAYADSWIYPASVWSHGEWWQLSDRESCVVRNRIFEHEARAQGVAGGRILHLDVQPLGATSALATGAFSRLRADGSTFAIVEASYLLVLAGADWKIATCILKD